MYKKSVNAFCVLFHFSSYLTLFSDAAMFPDISIVPAKVITIRTSRIRRQNNKNKM